MEYGYKSIYGKTLVFSKSDILGIEDMSKILKYYESGSEFTEFKRLEKVFGKTNTRSYLRYVVGNKPTNYPIRFMSSEESGGKIRTRSCNIRRSLSDKTELTLYLNGMGRGVSEKRFKISAAGMKSGEDFCSIRRLYNDGYVIEAYGSISDHKKTVNEAYLKCFIKCDRLSMLRVDGDD